MKKTILIIIIIISSIYVYGCKKDENTEQIRRINFFDYMNTVITINTFAKDDETYEMYKLDLENIFRTYHELTDNFNPLSEDSEFKENIYSINDKPVEKIEIDEKLYVLLDEAERLRVLTNGYFNVGIGKLVDLWKKVINDYALSEIPEAVFNNLIATVEIFNVEEIPYTLENNDGKYFITRTSEEVKIDLGALSKGYATNLAFDYLRSRETYFSISAGSSSIAVGLNIDRPDEDNIFRIALRHPREVGNYGRVKVKNTTVTTSGNEIQFATFEGRRYHHIISPITKMPMDYYDTVTVIGENAGDMDAISTALFSMNPEIFSSWFDNHQINVGIEAIRFNQDQSIATFLTNTIFEEF